eukprot:1713567-Prymnesium_polylepis.1
MLRRNLAESPPTGFSACKKSGTNVTTRFGRVPTDRAFGVRKIGHKLYATIWPSPVRPGFWRARHRAQTLRHNLTESRPTGLSACKESGTH